MVNVGGLCNSLPRYRLSMGFGADVTVGFEKRKDCRWLKKGHPVRQPAVGNPP